MANFQTGEITKLQTYLQSKFKNKGLTLRQREKAPDSLELLLDGEFLGTVYKDDEDGEIAYDFNMAILAMDLEDQAT